MAAPRSDAPARAAAIALGAGIVLVAAAAATVNVRVTAFALDETVLKQSAAHYTHGLPGSLFHDLSARGTARLYPLLIAPLVALFDGDVAVRAVRAFNALLFASAGVPLYLLARRVLVSPWRAVAAALLGGVAVPWLTISSAVYTENLAWPLYFWTILAILWTLRAPSPGRDAVCVALIAAGIGTRVQLVSLLPAYLVLVLWRERGAGVTAPAPAGRRVQRTLRRFPVLAAVVVIGVVVAATMLVTGQLHGRISELLGSYSEFQDRTALPSDTLLAVLVEVAALSLGIGIAPAIVGSGWYAAALSGRAPRDHAALARATLVAGIALVVVVVFAQGGYLGDRTEERYFVYLVPPLWIGTFAAIERREAAVSPRVLGLATGVLAIIFATIEFVRPLDVQTVFLAPVQESVGHALTVRISEWGLRGLTVRDVLGYGTLIVGALVVLAWSRRRRAREPLVVGIGVLAQVVIGLYAWSAIDGGIAGAGSRTTSPPTPAQLGWVDRTAAPGGPPVYLNNLVGVLGEQALATEEGLAFYNDDLAAYATIAGVERPAVPLSSLAVRPFDVDREGRLAGGKPLDLVVEHPQSAAWQMSGGPPLGQSPDGEYVLRRLRRPNRATWTATGLTAAGWVVVGRPVVLTLYPAAVRGRSARVTMVLTPPPGVSGGVTVRLGGQHRDVALGFGIDPVTIAFDECLRGRPVHGSVVPRAAAPVGPDALPVAGVLTQVAIDPGKGCR